MKKLTAENVTDVLKSLFFTENELVDGQPIVEPVEVRAVMMHAGLHPDRVEAAKPVVAELLSQLPHEFREDDPSGGWSFLNACLTSDGGQWGEHRNVDELLTLGLATEQIEFLLPREAWLALPGGVPYFKIKSEEKKS